ncbi:hypothetical protein BCR36DRAFT_579166 [Piromyces finnis]|uniref:BTB domain-containing protein n=1 Tax=Piromyces finnis TaxID=1754191 RepID=A0A1Y1VNX6_9FUNG|nr:hypothetical protein BCR36DRAFT_579166 [Piromyces finnis]|eukprot:ORX61109.1 hypothetical protein BCR36DRAFT_579166 [Piromyces finnis]
MCNTPVDTYVHLPSPPLSPFRSCENGLIESFICNDMGIQYKDLKMMENVINSPIEYANTFVEPKQDELRTKFMNMKEEGVQVNGELVPYSYFVQKLHSLGNNVINKQTKDAVPLRVYESGKETFQDFWVHPIFLSLQSFQFYKLFEEIKKNNEQGIIEIEVPSLNAFPIVLYWIYTGNMTKLLEVAKINNSLCKGIIVTIQYLELDMSEIY